MLYVISSGSFNLAALDRIEPCVAPIRRLPKETTRQYIERAMRDNHGYTVPQCWLADLDAIPAVTPENCSPGTWLGSTPQPLRRGRWRGNSPRSSVTGLPPPNPEGDEVRRRRRELVEGGGEGLCDDC